jgi:CheY-like chemotaxis protein
MSHLTATHPIRILVVEDNHLSFTLTSMMLERLTGQLPDRAENGEQALEMALEGSYDLVLMDQCLPGMSGLESTRQMRCRLADWQQPVIVGLSGSAAPRDVERAFAAGMDGFLAKPLRLQHLENLLLSRFCEPLKLAVG